VRADRTGIATAHRPPLPRSLGLLLLTLAALLPILWGPAQADAALPGLVAAYSFDDGSGTTVGDVTGKGHTGTISGATWSAAGKNGGALSFDGTNDWVTVADANDLDLTTGMTLEAWVRPTTLAGAWRTLIFKEGGPLAYSLYAHDGASVSVAEIVTGGTFRNARGTGTLPLNAWSHLAATYDGAALKLFVNGTQVRTVAVTGSMPVSTGVLRLGGNAVWSEWFAGLMDDVRVYNRALSTAEIQTDMNTSVGVPDTTPPTAPANFAKTGGTETSIATSWTASTDDVGVTEYRLYRNGASAGTATGTTFNFTGLTCGTPYTLEVEAVDAADNESARTSLTASTDACDQPPGAPVNLTAEGSLSSVALSWTGATDDRGIARYNVHRSTSAGFTPSAANRIAQPTGTSYTDAGRPAGTYFYRVVAEDTGGHLGPSSNEATATVTGDVTPPTTPAGLSADGGPSSVSLTWTGSTDNVAVAHYNVHRGTTAGFTPSAANRIAQPTGTSHADSGLQPGTYFYKVIAEDAAGNSSTPSNEASATVTGDITPPSPPGNPAATGGVSSVALGWSASTDNVGVVRYNVHRSTTPGFTPNPGNRVAQPTGTSHNDSGLAPGTYYYRVIAEDAAGNSSTPSSEFSATVTGDVTPPTTPSTLAAVPGPNSVSLTWTGSTDNVGVVHYNVHRSTTAGFTPSAANRIAQPTGASYTDSGVNTGTYFYKVTAEDAALNVSQPSNEAGATVSAAPPGLVAAYSFDAGQGTTLADLSGNGNTGSISGATWTTGGRFFSALTFDGVNDWVTVPDANSLDLTTGMTLEAWVRPSAVAAWRTVVFKEQPGNLVYGMYGNTNTNQPSGNVFVAGSDRDVRGSAQQLPANTWSHLAATYDGANVRLYVNGTLAGTLAQAGAITTSTGVLRIGGNAIWAEWFAGQIDEVRIYNRALTHAQIQSDMSQSVAIPDGQAPTAPSNLAASGGLGSASLTWTAATDNIGVDRYNVHRATTSGFTPSPANLIAQPTGTSYVDSGRQAGTYFYKVTAQDAAGNVGPPSNQASATVLADTTPPTVSITAPAGGATVFDTIAVSANASDNDAVVGVQFKLDGQNLGAEDTSAPYSIQWNTRTTNNGAHSLTAVARDATGNTSTSTAVGVTVDNSLAPPPGLVAGYGFDEKTGTTAGDASVNANNGTISGATRTPIGRFGSTLTFDGLNDWVTVPDAASLDPTSGLTLSAWLKPSALTGWRTAVMKETTGNHVWALYGNRNTNVPTAEINIGGIQVVNGTGQLPVNAWSHLAVTYDGSALRLYVNGSLVATQPDSGAVATSNGVLHIGGNSIWGEWFSGQIDEVRVYNRALSAGEIQGDMVVGVARDTRVPQVAATSPASGATGVSVAARVTATFDEAMSPASLTTSTFELRDSSGALVQASVSYDADTGRATLTPSDALRVGTTYTATLQGGASGARVTDTAGNALAADTAWSFTTEPAPPPILVLTDNSNGFTKYVPEILKAEGLSAYSITDVSLMSPGLLGLFDVVVVGEAPLNASQVTMLTNWVNAGGNLVALRPDKDLAPLLGLTDAGTTLANGYLLVNTGAAPGAGIVGQTIQFHGTADRYSLNGATAVATLYTNATNATSNPAVTLRSVGSNGGQAASFTYDLARSVALTRQGNPAWAGQNRDGDPPIRPDDLFFGGSEPDWVNLDKVGIPQADEQQRLLANLIEHVNRDRKPIPRFWYLPRGEKAAIVMTGDDHANGGTLGRFNQYRAASPAGCSVANWECVRSTSYIYPASPLTNAQASAAVADGFEVALHTNIGGGCDDWTPGELDSLFAAQRAALASNYPSVPAPISERTHCVAWSDYVSHAKVDLAYGVRFDTNYYHHPESWIGNRAGYMTGSAEIMRFADLDGTPIDVYQAHTHMTDEAGQVYPATVNTLLDKALGPEGYYGALTVNMHTDFADHDGSDAIVASALARGVPIVSSKQMLDWLDGRDASTFRNFTWSANTLGFSIQVGSGANGLQALLPMQAAAGTLSSLTRGGSSVSFTTQTIKGISYAVFNAAAGTYAATYQ
jgi:fibronectin type 3 domain-containing protein